MKRKDLAIVAVAAVIAAIFSIILSGALFSPKKNTVKVPVVTDINPVFPSPATDDQYKLIFNANSLNPTQLIQIGDDNNANPFQSTGQ